jgi:hypothetical protein
MMTFIEGSISELSLQHVLEDGLALTKGQLSEPQRQPVLKGIIGVFSEATQGASIVHNRALFIKAEEKSAFNIFSLVFSYLNNVYGDDLASELEKTKQVFENLEQGQDIPAQSLSASSIFIEKFLDALRLQQRLVPPQAPIVFN